MKMKVKEKEIERDESDESSVECWIELKPRIAGVGHLPMCPDLPLNCPTDPI